jgi:hypothetical protein
VHDLLDAETSHILLSAAAEGFVDSAHDTDMSLQAAETSMAISTNDPGSDLVVSTVRGVADAGIDDDDDPPVKRARM